MTQQSLPVDEPRVDGLKCGSCGNKELFVETMAYEAHLVDGQMNYLHLLGAEEDSYECYACGAPIESDPDAESK